MGKDVFYGNPLLESKTCSQCDAALEFIGKTEKDVLPPKKIYVCSDCCVHHTKFLNLDGSVLYVLSRCLTDKELDSICQTTAA